MIAILIATDSLGMASPPIIVDETAVAPPSRMARAQVGVVGLMWPAKDPDETLDYGNDLSLRVDDASDTIASTSATVVDSVSGAQVVAHYVNAEAPLTTTTWLSGGVDGTDARVQVRSVTAKGRRIDQTITLPIVTR